LPPHLRGKASASAAIEGDSDDTIADQTTTSGSSAITQDQAMQLITLLQNSFPNSTSSVTSSNQVGSASFIDHSSMNKGTCHSIHKSCSLDTWILDSGASHHICNSVQWFHSYNAITPLPIKLPNGDHVLACFSGSIQFSPNFIITEVLCVPNFSINLLSVSKLVQVSKYFVAFHASYCTIQDQLTRRMIGFAKALDGLYYLRLSDKVAHASANTTTTTTPTQTIPQAVLWHFRLGHL
jgi:hypothetical protein